MVPSSKERPRGRLRGAARAVSPEPLDAIYDPLLDQIVVGQLLLAAAKKKGLANDPEVQAMIARAKDNVLRDG